MPNYKPKPKGELSSLSKMTWAQVEEIRYCCEPYRIIAKRFNCSVTLVFNIKHNLVWKPEKCCPKIEHMKINFCYYRNERHFNDLHLASIKSAHENALLDVILHEDTPGDSAAYEEVRRLPYLTIKKNTLPRHELIKTIPEGEIFAEMDFLFLKPITAPFTLDGRVKRDQIICIGGGDTISHHLFYPIKKQNTKYLNGHAVDLEYAIAVYLWQNAKLKSLADLQATVLKPWLPEVPPPIRIMEGIVMHFD